MSGFDGLPARPGELLSDIERLDDNVLDRGQPLPPRVGPTPAQLGPEPA